MKFNPCASWIENNLQFVCLDDDDDVDGDDDNDDDDDDDDDVIRRP